MTGAMVTFEPLKGVRSREEGLQTPFVAQTPVMAQRLKRAATGDRPYGEHIYAAGVGATPRGCPLEALQ